LAGKTETFYLAEGPRMAQKAAVQPGWRIGACLIKCKGGTLPIAARLLHKEFFSEN